jgi:phosphate starvation-inducible protein PhoH
MNGTVSTLREQQDAALRFLKFAMTHDKTPEGAAKAIAIAVNEIETARDQILRLQDALAQAEGHVAQMKDVLGAYERWEADLIQYCEAWVDGLPAITQEFQDRLIEIGGMRNTVIRALPAGRVA